MTAGGAVRAVPGDQLHAMLDALLHPNMAPDAFWHFVAALAQGRGVADRLHEEGMEAVNAVTPSPTDKPADMEHKKFRAYQIGLLRLLLLDMHRGGEASVFPAGALRVGAICGDLDMMLAGKNGTGLGRPQFLYSNWDGNQYLAQAGRRAFVGAVYYYAAWHRIDPLAALSALGARDLNRSTWRTWVAKQGGETGDLVSAAIADGEAGLENSQWNLPPNKLERLWHLVRPKPSKK